MWHSQQRVEHVVAAIDLPLVDEHTVSIAAGADVVWSALFETLDRTFSRPLATAYARLVGCAHVEASGSRPLAPGATIAGFIVTQADVGRQLALEGRHRFAAYALTFRLEPTGTSATRLRAETRARFPGLAGRTYRLLVIGTGGHGVAVRRLLAGVRRAASA